MLLKEFTVQLKVPYDILSDEDHALISGVVAKLLNKDKLQELVEQQLDEPIRIGILEVSVGELT